MSETIFNSEEEYRNSLKGEKGDQGEQGIQGLQGVQGEKGDQGIQGEQGISGINGLDGKDGKDGEKGDVGKDGSLDTPNDIVGKINIATVLIEPTQVKGLNDIREMAIANAVPVTTSFFNGLRAKNLNITGGTTTQRGDTVTVAITGGGGTPAGSTGSVQINISNAFGSDSNLFFDTTHKSLNVGSNSSLAFAGFRINSNSTSDRPLVFTGTGVSVGGGTDTNAGVFAGMGYNGSPFYGDANMQFWIGSLNQIGNDSYSVFRYIVGFDIPMIDGVSAGGSSRRNINFGFIDNNISFGYDVTTASQADIIAKVDVIGNGTDNTSSNIRIRNSAGTVMLQITDDGLPYLNSSAIFSNSLGGPSGSIYAVYTGSDYVLAINS